MRFFIYALACFSRHGMFMGWRGRVFYPIPRGTNQIKLINPLWKNFYDRTLLTDNGVTPGKFNFSH